MKIFATLACFAVLISPVHADFMSAKETVKQTTQKIDKKIKKEKKMKEVVIYSTVMCPYCVRAKDLLKKKKVAYTEYFIEKDADKLAEMKKRTNNARTVPQIFIGDQHIGGFDKLSALDKSGELDKLLNS